MDYGELEKRVAIVLKFRPQIEKALEYAGHTRTFSGVIGEVVSGNAQVFGNDEGVVVTQIEDAETGRRVLNIWLAAGEMDEVIELMEDAVEWGQSVGAQVATSTGRRGWGRIPAVLEKGWKPEMTLYTREI